MGKVKSLVMDGEEFAQENYNVSRDEFIKLTNKAFRPMSIEARAAVAEYDIIQNDLHTYYAEYNNDSKKEYNVY